MDAASVHFSFLIPTAGRFDRLRDTLRALAELDGPAGSYEAVVVIDGGTSAPALSFAEDAGRMPIEVVIQEPSGPARARNVAAARARGEWLIFLDDDCRPSADFLRTLNAILTPGARLALGGQPVVSGSASLWSLATHLVVEAFVESRRSASGSPGFLPSQNLVLHRAAWEDTGGFNEEFRFAGAEDREFCLRWAAGGGAFSRVAALSYVHDHPLTFLGFLLKHFQYGQGAALCRQMTGAPDRGGYFAFARAAVRLAWTRPSRTEMLALLPALAMSQVATLAGVVAAQGRRAQTETVASPS